MATTKFEPSLLSLPEFQGDDFDCIEYLKLNCQPLSEKGVKTLHLELQKLKKKSADEMRKNALSNYVAFIRTLRRIASLEGSLHSMRSFLSSQALLFHSLTEGEPIVPKEVSDERNMIHKEETITTEIEHLASKTLDVVDELMIERKFHEAVASLEEVANLIRQAHREDLGNDRVMELEASLLQRRTSLVEQLSETTHQLSVRGQELRSALSALYHLGDGAHAQKLLFDSHHNRIHHGMMSLHLSGKLYVGGHTAALSQTVFSEILQTAKDSSAVFGDSPAYASRVIIWAFKELEAFVSLLKKSVLLVAGSLRAMVECMRITYGHCLLLQDHGLALCPFLSGLLRPVAKQIVHGKLVHMQDTLSALTAADDWRLAYPAISFVRSSRRSLQRLSGGRLSTESTLLVLSPSAHQFDGMVQGFGDDVSPLVDMHLEEGCLDGVRYLFDGFVRLLLMALNQARISRNTDQNVKKSQFVIRTAETLSQQLAILGSARVLAEEILPHAVLKLLHSKAKSISRKSSLIMDEENPDLANWRSYLNQGVMRLQDAFMNIYREIILQYACNGETKLIPELYIKYEIVGLSKDEMQKEMPSKFFQVLFLKSNEILKVASELLQDGHKVVILPLSRVTEAALEWLHGETHFWDEIEECKEPLSGNGLIHFILDMQFVVQFANNGGFCTSKLKDLASDMICRIQNIYAINGSDLASGIPEDKWFITTSQDACTKLLNNFPKKCCRKTM